MKETELAAQVVAWLEAEGWNVYQEVSFGGRVADIVAVRDCDDGSILSQVVECKTAFSLSVIAQAYFWRQYASHSFVAVPVTPMSDGRILAEMVCRDYGLGVIGVGAFSVQQAVDPRIVSQGKARSRLLSILREQHKRYAKAGSSNGGHFSACRGTMQNFVQAVRLNPGQRMRELIDGLAHHYLTKDSARSAIRSMVSRGEIKGVKAVKEGRAVRYYPDE